MYMSVNDHSANTKNGSNTESNIPSREGYWKYPSNRQFYNATTRKGNVLDKKLIPHIVQIHNQVNEEAWRKVLEYEDLHDCPNPFLSHFSNNNKNKSLKARLSGWIGYDPPFDRHDWFVERCGRQIKYIIDFYQGIHPKLLKDTKTNRSAECYDDSYSASNISVYIDARPAPTISGIFDRLRLSYRKFFNT